MSLRRLRDRRGQQGYTILELLLVVAISALLIGPVFAWMILVMRQQPVQRDTMVRTAQADMLRTYFTRDAAVAGKADFNDRAVTDPQRDQPPSGLPFDSNWPTWWQECRIDDGIGVPLVVLLGQGKTLTKTIYSIAPMTEGSTEVPGKFSLWRTVCAANTGDSIAANQVVEDIDPDATTATCSSPPTAARGDEEWCRGVTLTVQGIGASKPVVLTATRRTDSEALNQTEDGNFIPVARITVLDQGFVNTASPEYRLRLTAANSTDTEPGSTLTYVWGLPDGPGAGASSTESTDTEVDLSFNQPGRYWVSLKVTDSDGATNETSMSVLVRNRRPVVVADVTPLEVPAVGGKITMTATGSHDPDGHPLSYLWRITSEADKPAVLAAERLTADAQFDVPEWAVGPLQVVLVVTDLHGDTARASFSVTIAEPPGVDEEEPGGPTPTDPPVPGAPVAAFTPSATGGTSVSFDAGASTGTDLTYAWTYDLLLGRGTGSGAQSSHTYPSPGTYTAHLKVTDGANRTATATRSVVVPGKPATPGNVRVVRGDLVWDPVSGARRYQVIMDVSSNGCVREAEQFVAASAAPRRAIPPSPCLGVNLVATGRVRVEGAPGSYSDWSAPVDLTTAEIGVPSVPGGPGEPGGEVVK